MFPDAVGIFPANSGPMFVKNWLNSFAMPISLVTSFLLITSLVDRRHTGIHGLWTQELDAGLGTLDSGRWTLDAGLWTLDAGRWTLDAGLWTLDVELWTLDAGLRTLDAGLWAQDVRLWMLNAKLWTLKFQNLKLFEALKTMKLYQ